MVELTFFGGVKEIGGNRILLEDNGTRVFLDFGLSFSLRKKYYDEFLQARSFAIIDEYVAFGLLPAVKGLYRQDHLAHVSPKHRLLLVGQSWTPECCPPRKRHWAELCEVKFRVERTSHSLSVSGYLRTFRTVQRNIGTASNFVQVFSSCCIP